MTTAGLLSKPFESTNVAIRRLKLRLKVDPGTRTVISAERFNEILKRARFSNERVGGFTDYWHCQKPREVKR